RDEPGVARDSKVETFVALRLEVRSWRWLGVPVFIRAGKRLPVTCTEVLVRLRRPPALYAEHPRANCFRFRISPDVAIGLEAMALEPGEEMTGRPVELLATHHPEGHEMGPYERLLSDALRGDAALFAREDYVEEAWRTIDPILGDRTPLYEYEPGTWGPPEADKLA